MNFLFWGIATTMLIAAVSFVAFPLKKARLRPGTPVTLAIATVPITAIGLYFLLGSPGVESAQAHASLPPMSQQKTPGSVGTVADLIEGLRVKLQKDSDDAGGWMLLARSYDHLGRHADALDAYQRAQALGTADADLESRLVGKAITGPAIRGRIGLSPAAAAQVNPNDTVFIFAKESKEQRMPVVALRKPASELPITFVLTDKEMMVPGQTLEQYESLVVTARISTTGNAMDNSHGLEVWSDPVSPLDSGNVILLITGSDVMDDNDE